MAARLTLFEPQIEAIDAVVAHVLFDACSVRIEDLNAALITTLQPIQQRERLVVQATGVEREDFDLGGMRRDDVGQHHGLGAEAVRVDDVLVLVQRTLQQRTRAFHQRLQPRR